MEVTGAALATVIAQFISAAMCLLKLMRMRQVFDLRMKELRISKRHVSRIVKLGLPSGLTQMIFSSAMIIVQSLTNSFGTLFIAANVIVMRVDGFAMMPNFSFGTAMTTYAGQNVGAKKLGRVKSGVRTAQVMGISVTMLLAVVMVLFAPQLLRMFSTESDVLEYGVYFVRFISPFYALMCFTNTFAGALRGMGWSQSTMYICLFSFVVFRQIYLQAGRLFGSPLPWVTLAYPVGWLMAALLLGIWFRRALRRFEKQMQEENA
jgi:putative MATE family efflux protein